MSEPTWARNYLVLRRWSGPAWTRTARVQARAQAWWAWEAGRVCGIPEQRTSSR